MGQLLVIPGELLASRRPQLSHTGSLVQFPHRWACVARGSDTEADMQGDWTGWTGQLPRSSRLTVPESPGLAAAT